MIEFQVYGMPAPQGSKRHVGRGIMVESSAKVKPWREAVKWAALDAMKPRAGQGIPGPVELKVAFTLPRPKSTPKYERYQYRKPDLDKLLRSTLDALTDVGAIDDDARVVKITAWKTYPGGLGALSQPGAIINVKSALEAAR